jgi:SAM-dependent methyltransferase
MTTDPFAQFKAKQREIWAHFTPIEVFTTVPAAHLVQFSEVRSAQRVLDVGTGTGVVAITAARAGATVTGLDLSPALLERAAHHSKLAGLDITWKEGDAEALPFTDGSFDAVISQFGHMFAPRAEIAMAELLRVLKPGGVVAFSTWPPEHFVGKFFALTGKFSAPPPEGFSPPPKWGNVDVVTQRLGDAVTDVRFDRGVMLLPVLSLYHYTAMIEETVGPVRALIHAGDAAAIAQYRDQVRALASTYYRGNAIHQDYLLTRAIKR